jgi:hypothetical protein
MSAVAEAEQTDLAAITDRLDRINAALLTARDLREQPGTDDKVLAGWNGLMIAGFADGGRVLKEPRYVEAAERAAEFVLSSMVTVDGRLLRSHRAGEARIDGFMEDYAYFIRGLLALREATGDARWLREAEVLTSVADRLFRDTEVGGYYDTLEGRSDLFVRTKSLYDGAVPSANSVMLDNLVRIYEQTGHDAYLEDAVATITALSGVIKASPMAAVASLASVDRLFEISPMRLGQARPGQARGPVTISADASVIRVADGRPGSFNITLRMAKGFHVNAHEPGMEFLIPLRVTLTGGDGLALTTEYPAGARFDGPEGAMLVHSDTVSLPIRIEKTGPISGRPRIVVTYQACDDKMCLPPRDEMLDIRIEE